MKGNSKFKVKVTEPQHAPKTTLKSIKKSIKKHYQFLNGLFNGFWSHVGIILSLKYSPKFNRKSMHFLLRKTSKIYAKMTSFWEARGGPTNQLFAPWTHVGGTLAPQGTPGCPKECPDTLQRAKCSKIGAQNHSKSHKNDLKIHEQLRPRPLKIMKTKL